MVAAVLVLVTAVVATPSAHADDNRVADPTTFTEWEQYMGTAAGPWSTGRVWTDKSVSTSPVTLRTYDDKLVTVGNSIANDEFLIGLSAMSSAQQVTGVTSTTQAQPLDITLVLDVSGSMGQNMAGTTSSGSTPVAQKRLTILKGAVQKFLTNVANSNKTLEKNEQNRVGLITYSADPDNTQNPNYSQTQRRSGYTDELIGNNSLNSIVQGLSSGGITRADKGLGLTEQLISEQKRANAKSIVVFFTDGVPTSHDGGDQGLYFNSKAATDAIETAKKIKDAGSTIYALGIFNGAAPNSSVAGVTAAMANESNRTNTTIETRLANNVMQAVSSNYPNATSFITSPQNTLGQKSSSKYYLAASTDVELDNAFTTIWKEISSLPTSPIQSTTTDGVTNNGSVVFTDQLGDYMTVRGFDSVVFAGNKYSPTEDSPSTVGDTDTYIFTGKIEAGDVYGAADMSTLEVKVQHHDGSKGDTVTVTLPSELLPLRLYSADVAPDGTVTTSTKRTNPIRIFYKVGLQEGVNQKLAQPDTAMNQYLANNTVGDKATFITNAYTTGNEYGNTTAVFTPAETNEFYYFTQDTPLYTGKTTDNQAKELKENETYYYPRTYYDDGQAKVAWEEVPGKTAIAEARAGTNGYYVPQGKPRLLRAAYTTQKTTNATDTATSVNSPVWDGNTVEVALGNNGRVNVPLPATLRVEKEVDWGNGTDTEPGRDFTMNLELGNGVTTDAEYTAQRFNADDTKAGDEFTVSKQSSFTLKSGQYALIYGLPETTYTLTEAVLGDGWQTPQYTNNEGQLSNGQTSTVMVKNTYTAQPATLARGAISGTKVLNGRPWQNGRSFLFTITGAAGTTVPLPEETTVELKNSDTKQYADGEKVEFSFGDIVYDKVGVYQYVVTETVPDDRAPQMAYSHARYIVTVTVTDDHNGQLVANAVMTNVADDSGADVSTRPEVDSADFVNTFTGNNVATAQINGIKNYTDHTGGNPLTRGKFQAKVQNTTPADILGLETASLATGDKTAIVEVGLDGTWTQPLRFTQDAENQTFTFTVTEVVPEGVDANNRTKDGMTYDTSTQEVMVQVKRDASGNLVANVEYLHSGGAQRVEFTNEYTAAPTTPATVLGIRKQVTGHDAEANKFTLSMQLSSGNADGVRVVEPGTNEAGSEWPGNMTATTPAITAGNSAEVPFKNLRFTLPGTYEFRVTEQLPDGTSAANPVKEGWTYDTHTYTVRFEVTDNQAGQLVATRTDTGDNNRIFINAYHASGSYEDDGTLQIGKTLMGRDLRAEEFTFRIEPVDGAPALADSDVTVSNPFSSPAGDELVWPVNGTLLGSLRFTEADAGKTYRYRISEVLPEGVTTENPTHNGITYDTTSRTVAITVKDDGDGTISTTTTVEGNNAGDTVAHFTNRYTVANTSVTPEFGKTLEGREWTDSDTFTFSLDADVAASTVPEAVLKKAMPSNSAAVNKNNATSPNTQVRLFDFGAFNFEQAGTYVYTIKETGTPADGVTHDARTATLIFTVVDNGNGQWAAGRLVTGVDLINRVGVFVNTYEAQSFNGVPTNMEFSKTLSGVEWSEDRTFEFTITGEEGAPMPAKDKVTVGKPANGSTATFDFGAIEYTKPGTYVYEVAETEGKMPGVSYDSHKASITVTVTDNGKGQLEATATVEGGAAFTNTYSNGDYYTGVPTGFTLTKSFTGKTWENESFDFTITPLDGAPAPLTGTTATTVTRPVEGGASTSFNFGQFHYTQPGTYRYEVQETAGDIAGVTYDTHTATVTVEVTDNGKHKLEAKATVTEGEFINTYRANPAEGVPTNFTLTKQVTGRDWADDESFTFSISAQDGAPMPANGTVSVSKPEKGNSASFNFGSIRYEKEGTYRYTIKEIAGSAPGMQYDTHEATVTVVVTDNGGGTLTTATTVENGLFTNHYALETVAYPGLISDESLTGRPQGEGEFSVRISGETESMNRAGYVARSMSQSQPFSAADSGEIVVVPGLLSGLEITQEDVANGTVFEYHVDQIGPESGNGLTVDGSTYDVKVWGEDNGDGKIAVHTTVNGEAVNELPAVLPFRNMYVANPVTVNGDAPVRINATKTLTGRSLNANEFSFVVRDVNGTELSTGTNSADGAITFTPIEFTTERLLADVKAGTAVAMRGEGNTTDYHYQVTVAERTDNLPDGVTVVAGGYAVTIIIHDDANGSLSAQVVYPDGSDNNLAFVNRYGNKSPVSLDMTGNKQLVVDSGNNPPDITGKYTFTLTGSEGAPMPERTTTTNDAAGAVDFGEIEFSMQNVFGDDGTQTEPSTQPEATDTEATDSEATDSAEQKGTDEAEQKSATSEDATDAAGTDDAAEEAGNGDAAADTGNDGADTGEGGNGGTTDAAEPVTRERTFTYTITETGTLPGVTNDARDHTVTVRVVDDGSGNLTIIKSTDSTAAVGMDFTFTNRYSVDPVGPTDPAEPDDPDNPTNPNIKGGVPMTKTLTGRDLKDGEFAFEMLEAGGKVAGTGTAAADGTVDLSGVIFYEPGEYGYVVREVQGNAGGVTYDDRVYGAVATVVDNGDGTLGVTWTVTDAEGNPVDAMKFTNTYVAAPTSVQITAGKTLVGGDLSEGAFAFTLRGLDNAPMPAGTKDGEQVVSNNADGDVQFGTINITEAGEYRYEVSEIDGKDDTIRYDGTVHSVIVRATDDGEGHIVASVEYGDDQDGITFTNVMVPNKPDDPTNPDDPSKPDDPTTPDDPSKPVDSDEPATPVTPSTPITNTHVTTTWKSTSGTLKSQSVPYTGVRLANTGANVVVIALAVLVLLAGGVGALLLVNRRQSTQEAKE